MTHYYPTLSEALTAAAQVAQEEKDIAALHVNYNIDAGVFEMILYGDHSLVPMEVED